MGCYLLTGAVESSATTLEQIVLELLKSLQVEREGRTIDKDENASMEQEKGIFNIITEDRNIHHQNSLDTLRFITCGSVDDGKSNPFRQNAILRHN